MNIKILTFSQAPNYGALLQCYALSKVLIKMNYNVELVNIPFDYMNSFNYKIRNELLYGFVKRFHEQYLPNSVSLNNLDFDATFIVGSDQVWNIAITKESYLRYFFDFLPNQTKRISYAASFGFDEWVFNDKNQEIRKLLNKFSSISVRESEGVKICNEYFEVDSSLVLDPTLLIEDYSELIGNINIKKNLVGYKLNSDKKWRDLLKFIADKKELTIVDLFPTKISFFGNLGGFNRKFLDVPLWLKNIAESSFVVTDSFHGTIFSILFKKNFIVVPSVKSRMGRVKSLLKILNIESRYYNSMDDVYLDDSWLTEINYNNVFIKLDHYRKLSLSFLKSNI